MPPMETVSESVKNLIDTYTKRPEDRTKKVEVSHDGFERLTKDTRKLIEGVLKELSRNDFEIARNVFLKKFEVYLRLIVEALREVNCVDEELQTKISETCRQIATVVKKVEVSDEDMKWLKETGFLPVDIFELTKKLNMPRLIIELRKNIEEYKEILGDEKYIRKILKTSQGLDKLKRLLIFCGRYDNDIVSFNGYDLAQIVFGAGWEDKLKYFEDPENLEKLQRAGFDGSNLAQIVSGAGWKDKLEYFEEPKNSDRLKAAGFKGYHLAQIVLGKCWRDKLEYFENDENLKRLQKAGFKGYHLAQIVLGKCWRDKLDYFANAENLRRLQAAGFNGSNLAAFVRNADWKDKLDIVIGDACPLLLIENSLTYHQLAKLFKKKDWRSQLERLTAQVESREK